MTSSPSRRARPRAASSSTTARWDYNGDGVAVTRNPVPGWPVNTGYDMTTGLGTPNAPAYVAGLLAAP